MAFTSHQFIDFMPKVELHLHIEGTFEPELVFEIAQRNGLDVKAGERVFATPEALREAYKFNNLQEFLDVYYAGMNVLQREEDFYDLTMAYFERVHQDRVVHAEIMFDPQGHTARGVPIDTVINGIYRATQDAQDKFGISSGLIMSFLRHLPQDDAIKTWEETYPHLDKIIGVGLDSSENGHPPEKFKDLYQRIKAEMPEDFLRTAHAGEEGPPAYVWSAYNEDILDVHRIDHGNRALEDHLLVDALRDVDMCMTMCPLSNLALKGVESLEQHMIGDALKAGLKVTVSSDDPAYFGGYIGENFRQIYDKAPGIGLAEIATLAHNAIDGAWVNRDRREAMKRQLAGYLRDVQLLTDDPDSSVAFNPTFTLV